MALTYLGNDRTMSIRGIITQSDGTQLQITEADVIMYSSSPQIGAEGLPLGSVSAASFALELDNVGRKYSPQQFDNAEVHMRLGLLTGSEFVYTDFGTWYVESSSAPEQSVSITLFGYDALNSKFTAEFVDSESAYPSTIGSLVTTVCTAAGIPLKKVDFANAAVPIDAMPLWPEETTLRDVLSYCAICAAGFARIDSNGELEILSFSEGNTYDLNPDIYSTFALEGGSTFSFNCIEAKLTEDAEEYSRFAIDSAIADNATNTIQIDYNPLLTESIVQSIVNELNGIDIAAGVVTWVGDPSVKCGDFFTITDLKGATTHMMATSLKFAFRGGLTCSITCDLPSINTANSTSYSTAGSMYDSNGNLKATRISGLDGRVITATAAHFEKLTVGDAAVDRLTAAVIQALTVRADAISSGEIRTDELTALIAKIVQATIDKIDAGTIKTDELNSALATIAIAQITTANIDKANIDWAEIKTLTAKVAEIVEAEIDQVKIDWAEIENADIDWANIATLNAQIAAVAEAKIQDAKITVAQIDQLDAAVAKIVSATIATGDFDLAAIKNLLANAFVLEQGIADSIYIKNLAVTAANLLSATLGELVLKGSDGRYYKIVVGSDGTIATKRVGVTGDEISAGTTNGGQMIVETTANIADLNATTIKGSQAVLDTILTQSLTAGKITAGQALIASATIPALYVTSVNALGNSIDFSANESIRLMVSQHSKVYRQENAPEGALPGDLWIQPSTGYTYQAVGSEDGAPEFSLTDDGYLMYRYADGKAEYTVEIDENGWLVIDSDSPFQWTASSDGILTAWSRVKDGDLTSAELSITDTKIALGALKTSYDEQGEHIADLEADLTVQAEKIEGKVSQTIYDEGIATLEASIAEQAGLIESKVSQTVYEAEKANHSKVFRQEHPPQGAKVGDLWIQPSSNYTYQAIGPEDGAPEFSLSDDGYLMYRYADGETEYQLIIDEDGWLVIDEDAPFVWASNDDGSLTTWSRVKDGDLASAETIIRQNTEEIDLRVRKATYDLEKVYRSDAAPEDPAKDLMWLDTSLTPPILKKWDGEVWIAVGAQDVKNSSVTINDKQVLIDTGEFILRLHDPDDAENVLMEMSADGNGGFTQLYAQKIYSPSVVSIYEGASVAVSSAAELEALLQDLRGKYISAPLTISIYGLTSGNFELYGIDGPGDINIVGGVVNASGCTINSLTVTRCRARIDVENVTISTSGTAVSVDASTVRLTGCVINAANGIIANFGAMVEAENCTGACTAFLAIPQHGSSMFFTGEIPVGLPDLSGTGNIYTDAVFTAVPAEEEPEELPTITTVTLKPTLTKTFRGSSWRDTNYLWQGRYGSASLSRGCMWFDTSAFSGKTILSATLRLTRMTGSGAGVFVTTNIYATTAAGASGTPAVGTKYASVDLDQGQTKTVDVTNAITALAAGTIKGLMLYDGSTENLSTASPYTRHYAKYYGYDHGSGPQLTVTYK